MNLEETWQTLEEDNCSAKPGILVRRIYPESNKDLFIGIKKPTNTRLLIIRISKNNVPDITAIPESKGFIVFSESLFDDNDNLSSMVLMLSSEIYKDIFTALIEDIITHIVNIDDEISTIQAFLVRLLKWQKFLEKYSNKGLDNESQRGLYGELWFLKRYLLSNISIDKAINYWTGPEYSRHDFQLPNCSVEVKVTLSKQHQMLRISSERQLDEAAVKLLYLFHLSLDSLQGRGETLPAIIEKIRKEIKTNIPACLMFEEKLFEAGYLDEHSSKYQNVGYARRDSNIFKVIDGFPRIIERDLPNGVGDVSYSISVAECMHFKEKENIFLNLIQGTFTNES